LERLRTQEERKNYYAEKKGGRRKKKEKKASLIFFCYSFRVYALSPIIIDVGGTSKY
jgi:hypothetical protein